MVNGLAWAAGLFEGEGSISLHPEYKSVRLQMTQSDHDVLLMLQSICGGSIDAKTFKNKPTHYKETWSWRLNRADEVRALLEKFLPYFGSRRAYVAQNALDKLDGC